MLVASDTTGQEKNRREKSRRARLPRLARAALVVALLWPPLAWCAARALIVSAGDLERADALAVLAGSSAYVERNALAARLFREGRAPVIILTNDAEQSGWSSAEQRNPLFVERAVAELTGAGVPRAQIEVLPRPVSSTYEEAQALREYADAHRLHSLCVVTSAYHSRRALWTLRRAFRESDVKLGLAPVEPGEQMPRPALWWLRARGWQAVAGEYAKLAYYRVRYD